MEMEKIGFYTLCNERCQNLSPTSPMWRCEIILTDRCNFNCPYCRGLRKDCQGDMSAEVACGIIQQWGEQGLKHLRLSGGEPLFYPELREVVSFASRICERVAISSNGSFILQQYLDLVEVGVSDFSISLDACCAAKCGKMAGISETESWHRLTTNIRELSKRTYVSVGVVLTDENCSDLADIVQFAHDLGVADIRIIPAAQNGNMIHGIEQIQQDLLDAHPILAYRVGNLLEGQPVRSIQEYDSHRCYIPIDDSIVAGDYHFPCVIYMREGGEPIGQIGPDMRQARIEWSEKHDSFADPICRNQCLDVCVAHNNNCGHYHATPQPTETKR